MSYTIVSGTKFFYYNFIMIFYMFLNSFINIYDDVILSFYIKSTNTFMDIDRETYKNLKKNRLIKFIDFLIEDNVNTLSIDNDDILYTISGVKNHEKDLKYDEDDEDKEEDNEDVEDDDEEDEEEEEEEEEDVKHDEDIEDDIEDDNEDEEDEEDEEEEEEEEEEEDLEEDEEDEEDDNEEEDKITMFKFEDNIDYSYKKNKKQKIN